MTKVRDFKVGDKVYSLHWGDGVVININPGAIYPVEVKWSDGNYDCFTAQGQCDCDMADSEIDIVPIDEVKKEPHFKVGDRVWSPHFGAGIVTNTEADSGAEFPIEVKFDNSYIDDDHNYFTKDGQYDTIAQHPNFAIYPIESKHATNALPKLLNELKEDSKEETEKKEHNPLMIAPIPLFDEDDEDEGTVERMEDALNKKVEDAINPSHYKVEGLPEAIDIMNHLMTPEQFEGFLWGNIMKYAYRFGRKGDKAETAGKIAWYANQLKAVEEWGKEHNET